VKKKDDNLKSLLNEWQILQHREEFEEYNKLEKEIKKIYNIDMNIDWEKYLLKYNLIGNNYEN